MNTHTSVASGAQGLPGQPRFADPGRPAEDYRRKVLVACKRDLLELAAAAHQRR